MNWKPSSMGIAEIKPRQSLILSVASQLLQAKQSRRGEGPTPRPKQSLRLLRKRLWINQKISCRQGCVKWEERWEKALGKRKGRKELRLNINYEAQNRRDDCPCHDQWSGITSKMNWRLPCSMKSPRSCRPPLPKTCLIQRAWLGNKKKMIMCDLLYPNSICVSFILYFKICWMKLYCSCAILFAVIF
jgi:hypothetical protein